MSRRPDWAVVGFVLLLVAAVVALMVSGCARTEPPTKPVAYLRCTEPALQTVLEIAAEHDKQPVYRPRSAEVAVPQAWAVALLSDWAGMDLTRATIATDGRSVLIRAGWSEETERWLAGATRESLATTISLSGRPLYPVALVRRYYVDPRAVVALTIFERMHSQGCGVVAVRVPA